MPRNRAGFSVAAWIAEVFVGPLAGVRGLERANRFWHVPRKRNALLSGFIGDREIRIAREVRLDFYRINSSGLDRLPRCVLAASSASEVCRGCRPCTRRPQGRNGRCARESVAHAAARRGAPLGFDRRRATRSASRHSRDSSPATAHRLSRQSAAAAVDVRAGRGADRPDGQTLSGAASAHPFENGAAWRLPARRAASSSFFSRSFCRFSRSQVLRFLELPTQAIDLSIEIGQ
jgi:hypothetical protein